MQRIQESFAGRLVIEEGFKLIDERIKVELHKKDGDLVEKGEIIATVQGPIASLLTAERVILNVIQRMSGIATMTYEAVRALDSSHTRICDTRKTMPGLRMFDKYAVVCGGGFNHRFGLYDGVMIKDNHIAFCWFYYESCYIGERKIRTYGESRSGNRNRGASEGSCSCWCRYYYV